MRNKDGTCIARPTVINMNTNKLKYYLFIISLSKCTGSCNVLSPKRCLTKKYKRHIS